MEIVSTFYDKFVQLFGEYRPIEVIQQYKDAAGKVYSSVNLNYTNYTYIFAVLGFFLVVYCFFRILGGIINRV